MKTITTISKAMLLSLVCVPAAFADIHDRIEYKLNRVLKDVEVIINGNEGNCTPITQLAIDQGGGVFTITQSGEYCVTDDVTGLIVVDADCVCIDLSCHTVDAGGAPNAFAATNHTGLKIFNGCITNSSEAAILLSDYSAVELYNLHLFNFLMNGIEASTTLDINVHDVDFINAAAGERALLFNQVNNITVNRCNASGFLSTIGAVIEFNTCNAASVQDVNVTQNIKSAASGGSFATSTMFVAADGCTGLDFLNLKVNNNTIDTAGANRSSAIGIKFSNNCSLQRCEINNNQYVTSVPAELCRMLFIGRSDNVIATDLQVNNNSCPVVMQGDLRGISPLDSSNLVFDGCQVNNNFMQASAPNSNAGFYGIFLQNGGALPVEDNVIRNCQVNFNRIEDGGSGRSLGIEAYVAGIAIQRSAILDHCQACHNSIGTTDVVQYVEGLILFGTSAGASTGTESVENVIVSNSSFDSNIGGEFGIGINILASESSAFILRNMLDVTISNCSANSNGNYGIWPAKFYQFGEDDSLLRNLVITDCVFNRNGNRSLTPDAAGIYIDGVGIFNVDDTVSNILIKSCQVNDTAATSFANGIRVRKARNVVIEDTNVYSSTTTSTVFPAHGILFDTVKDSKIIRTQVHGNQNSGVELVGSNTTVAIIECVAMDNDKGFEFAATSTASCCLVQDSRALSNVTAGFVHATSPLTTTFIGNEAQCNGATAADNYVINGGVINLQELTWSTGAVTQITGSGAVLGSPIANLRAVA